MKLCMHVYLRKGQYAKGGSSFDSKWEDEEGGTVSIDRYSGVPLETHDALNERVQVHLLGDLQNQELVLPKPGNTLRPSSPYRNPLNFPLHHSDLDLWENRIFIISKPGN